MKNKKINSAAVKMGCGLLAGVLAPGVVHACACGCGVFDVARVRCFPTARAGWLVCNMIIRTRTAIGAALRRRRRRTMATRKLRRTSSPPVCNICSTAVGALQIEVPYDYRIFQGEQTTEPATLPSHHRLGPAGRHPARGHLHGIFCGFVRRRDVRPEIADGR